MAQPLSVSFRRMASSGDFWACLIGSGLIGLALGSAWLGVGVFLVATATRRR